MWFLSLRNRGGKRAKIIKCGILDAVAGEQRFTVRLQRFAQPAVNFGQAGARIPADLNAAIS